MQILDHVFLVAGGSSGLGAACVRRFVAAGGCVVIADVNQEAGVQLAAEFGGSVRFVHMDVTQEESVQTAVSTTFETFGGLHGVVNCAGVATAMKVIGRTTVHDLAAFHRVIQINLLGAFNVMRLTAAAMSTREPSAAGERGVIINTASVAAFDGQIGQVAYAASKGGVVSMTLPAAREFARYGIRVMTIAPGIFDTPMLAGLPEKARASLGEQVPFPSRLGRPEEYAALAQHIIENEMLNGEVVRLDGAIRMAPK